MIVTYHRGNQEHIPMQLLGVDILLDHKLRPHLLEINAHPSLRVDFEQPKSPGVVSYVPSPVDMAIKLPVVKDTLRIIAAKMKRYVHNLIGTTDSMHTHPQALRASATYNSSIQRTQYI